MKKKAVSQATIERDAQKILSHQPPIHFEYIERPPKLIPLHRRQSKYDQLLRGLESCAPEHGALLAVDGVKNPYSIFISIRKVYIARGGKRTLHSQMAEKGLFIWLDDT